MSKREEVIDLTDITQICRICLKRNDLLLPLDSNIEFEGQEFSPISVKLALVSLTSIRIDIQTNLPSQICWDCKQLTKHALLLKYRIEKSISILKIFTSGILSEVKCPTEKQQFPKIQLQRLPEVQEVPIVLQQLSGQVNVEVIDDDSKQDIEQHHSPPDIQEYDSPVESNERADEQNQGSSQPLETQTTPRKKLKLHQCPVCMLELSALELRDHVHKHRALKKYLSIPKVSPTAKFYTKPKKVFLPLKENRLHECPFCKTKVTATEFRGHINNHKLDSEFSCEKCDRTFSKLSYLNLHRIQHLKELPYRCAECNKGFVLKKNYDYHLLLHKDILLYACEFCPRRFSNPQHLHRHRIVHIENRSYGVKYKVNRCQKCLRHFRSHLLLRDHDCVPVNKFPCKYCHKIFNRYGSLADHRRRMHIPKLALCQICGVKSKNIASHMRVHNDSTKRKNSYLKGLCPVCGLHVSNIYSHMDRHNNIRAHKCSQCSKAFFTRQLLRKHQIVHTGLKPFMCGTCGKSFNSQHNLKVHERIHLGIKRHICNICNKGFLEKSYLKKHMSVHANLDGGRRKKKLATTDLLMEMDIKEELASKFEFYEM